MGDAIRSAPGGFDQPPFLEAIKRSQGAVRQHIAAAVETSDRADFAIWQPFKVDRATLSQNMQNTLFVF
jgi:hypothetical protein